MNNISELLDQISSPDDLRHLSVAQLPELCAELRRDIVDELSVNPGHLASSLGVVELTVALHYVFSTPYDRIVWDVGHQAYCHKILTAEKTRSAPTANCMAYAHSRLRWRASTTHSRVDTLPTQFRQRSVWLSLHANRTRRPSCSGSDRRWCHVWWARF